MHKSHVYMCWSHMLNVVTALECVSWEVGKLCLGSLGSCDGQSVAMLRRAFRAFRAFRVAWTLRRSWCFHQVYLSDTQAQDGTGEKCAQAWSVARFARCFKRIFESLHVLDFLCQFSKNWWQFFIFYLIFPGWQIDVNNPETYAKLRAINRDDRTEWESKGFWYDMICIWHVYDMYMICIWYDMYIICVWYVYDMYMISIRYVYDMNMLCIWMYMICGWYVYDMCMICVWYVYDMYMLCIWYIYIYDMYMICNICIWYVYDMYIICIWYYMICVWYVYIYMYIYICICICIYIYIYLFIYLFRYTYICVYKSRGLSDNLVCMDMDFGQCTPINST